MTRGATPTDELARLHAALQASDRAALDALLAPLRERLLRLAKGRLRGSDRAEEVVQETLVTLWEKRSSVRDPDHVLPFVFQVLRHKIGNVYLREQRQQTQPGADHDTTEATDADPHTIAEARQLEAILAEAIGRCATEEPLLAQVLQLLKQGKSHAEIQEALGAIPRATVRTRIFRARKRLREILKQCYQIEL